MLVKPITYMNRSGNAVGEVLNFYKLSAGDLIVIHDEVDLPPGKIRMKAGGGVAGHNGLRSIGAAIGSDFRRLRIGVGHPGAKERVAGYVLHDFAKSDAQWLQPLLEAIAENAPLLADGKDSTFANRLHEALAKVPSEAPPAEETPKREGAIARGLRKLFGG